MGHQELHLVGKDAPIAQNEILPQAGHIGGVQQRHVRLLGCATALSMVATFASGDHIHPVVLSVLRKWGDVLTGELAVFKQLAAVGAQFAVAGKQLGVGQGRRLGKRVDAWHTFGANDAADGNGRLHTSLGVVATVKYRHLAANFPAHFVSGVMQHRLF